MGAGLLPLAVLGSLFIGLILVVFVNKKSVDSPYILIVSSEDEGQEDSVLGCVKESVKRYSLKSKTISESGMEFTLEIHLKDSATKFIGQIKGIAGVRSAALVSYNGDYMS